LTLLFPLLLHPPPPTDLYTPSLHDALPIYGLVIPSAQIVISPDAEAGEVAGHVRKPAQTARRRRTGIDRSGDAGRASQLLVADRSEEHTSELQSPDHLVCRLLLEKKKKKK